MLALRIGEDPEGANPSDPPDRVDAFIQPEHFPAVIDVVRWKPSAGKTLERIRSQPGSTGG